MQVDWLKTFVTIADTGSFNAAAASLYRSQSRVSAHIAGLESEVGAEMFDRSQRPVRLTDAGESFLHHARAILDRFDVAQSEIASIRGLRRGHVSLGTFPSASAAFLPGILAEFGRKYDGIHLELAELSLEELDASLLSNRVSLILRPTYPSIPSAAKQDLGGVVLWREPLCVVLPEDHALAQENGPIAISELADEQIIAPNTVIDPGQHYPTEDLTRQTIFVTNNPQTLIALTLVGLGVGVTNQLALSVSNLSGVHVRQIADDTMRRDVGLYWNLKSYRSAATDALYRTIISTEPPPGTERLFRP